MEIKEIKIPNKVKVNDNEAVLESTYDQLSTFKANVVAENTELITKQGSNMGRFADQLKSLNERMKKNKQQCQLTIKNQLQEQTDNLDSNIERYTKELSSNNKEEGYRMEIKKLKEEYIKICKKRIQTASKINMFKLTKIQIQDRKSKANEVFKWVMVSMYDEAQSKYYWPNFLTQAIENDKGTDLRERLGKINAARVKDEQRMKTEFFINNLKHIIECPELETVKEDVKYFGQIAEDFRRGYELTHKIKQNEESIKKNKEYTIQKDQEFVRWRARSEALKDRIKINRQYHKVLTNLEQKLVPKSSLYEEKGEQAKKLSQEFSKLLSWQPTINLAPQQKNQCECMIF